MAVKLAAGNDILFDGMTPDEILRLSRDEIKCLVLTGKPIVVRAGTAEILGSFRIDGDLLVIELAQVEGGGEGVLPALWRMAQQYARASDLRGTEWIVHAVNCANPNPKLRRVLERRGFEVRNVPGIGEAYYNLIEFG
jgi:hypothetical protein